MNHFIKPGDVVYDVGAEEGDFPALFALWGADVVLIEPNPKVWPNIRAIFEANELVDHVSGIWCGFAGDEYRPNGDWVAEHVGAHRDERDNDLWPLCSRGPVISDHGFLVLPERPDVPVITLDTLRSSYGAPQHITIDVEGAELTVLRGADKILRTYRPYVFVSVHIDMPWIDEKYPGDTGEKLNEYMAERDYEGVYLTTDHEQHWIYVPKEKMWQR